MTDIMKYFPLPSPREMQERVIRTIDANFKKGTKIFLLEAPVGSGKSAIAMTIAKAYGSAHILTPRRSLQDQYYNDFKKDGVVTMKGRGAYPCPTRVDEAGIVFKDEFAYESTIKAISKGVVKAPSHGERSCSGAVCENSEDNFNICVKPIDKQAASIYDKYHEPCPYSHAIAVAESNDIVIHNIHSFFFQTHYADRFDKRDLLIIDEAHEIEDIIRGFLTRKVTTPKVYESLSELKEKHPISWWVEFLSKPEHIPTDSVDDRRRLAADESYQMPSKKYLEAIESIKESFTGDREFSVRVNYSLTSHAIPRKQGTSFEFVPHYVGGFVKGALLDYGEHILFMSGTVFGKKKFCETLGLNPADVAYISVPSEFPAKNRPIIHDRELMIDCSHKGWEENKVKIFQSAAAILNENKEHKGLIHVGSYHMANEFRKNLPSDRFIFHDKGDFDHKLAVFRSSTRPVVLVSPVCQQGIDFKHDQARFQIVTRVPYLNTSDEFIRDKQQMDIGWYNHKALVVFGQMLGRPVRDITDWGRTYLLDYRFIPFLKRFYSSLPQYLKDAMVYR